MPHVWRASARDLAAISAPPGSLHAKEQECEKDSHAKPSTAAQPQTPKHSDCQTFKQTDPHQTLRNRKRAAPNRHEASRAESECLMRICIARYLQYRHQPSRREDGWHSYSLTDCTLDGVDCQVGGSTTGKNCLGEEWAVAGTRAN